MIEEVNGNEVGTCDSVVRIICNDTGKTIYKIAMGDDTDEFLSLNDCLKLINYDGKSTCIVIIDDSLNGIVYQYNNYGNNKWYAYGKTNGYA